MASAADRRSAVKVDISNVIDAAAASLRAGWTGPGCGGGLDLA